MFQITNTLEDEVNHTQIPSRAHRGFFAGMNLLYASGNAVAGLPLFPLHFSPWILIRNARNTISDAIKEEGRSHTYMITHPAQIEDCNGQIPENVLVAVNLFALTMPTYHKVLARDDKIQERQRLNGLFSDIEGPLHQIVTDDFMVYRLGQAVCKIDPKKATATLLRGYFNPEFVAELESAGYKFQVDGKIQS